MHNAVMCTLSLYDVIGITRHLLVKLKSFSNIAQPLHKEAVCRCSFSFITAKKSVIMSEAFLVDVSICSAQSENLDNSGIALREVRIPKLADRVRILTLHGTIPELSVRKVRIGTK